MAKHFITREKVSQSQQRKDQPLISMKGKKVCSPKVHIPSAIHCSNKGRLPWICTRPENAPGTVPCLGGRHPPLSLRHQPSGCWCAVRILLSSTRSLHLSFFIWHQFVPFGGEAIFKFKCKLQLVFLSTMGALVPRVTSL